MLAGNGEHKTWWRNFRTPHRVDVLIDGRWHAATGRAVLNGDPRRTVALSRYRVHRTRIPPDTADPLLVIELD